MQDYEAYMNSGIVQVQISIFCLWMNESFWLRVGQSPHQSNHLQPEAKQILIQIHLFKLLPFSKNWQTILKREARTEVTEILAQHREGVEIRLLIQESTDCLGMQGTVNQPGIVQKGLIPSAWNKRVFWPEMSLPEQDKKRRKINIQQSDLSVKLYPVTWPCTLSMNLYTDTYLVP